MTKEKFTLKISLNGTDTNPFAKWGLSQNPFPQIAKAEITEQVLRIQALGGEPIPDADYIRTFLQGYCSPKLIDLCVSKFVKGQIVHFSISWEN